MQVGYDKMNKRDLRSMVLGFRNGLLNGAPSHRMCYAVSAALQGYLAFLGVETKLVEGGFKFTNHFWLEMPDGTIIDPTADQFTKPTGEPMPKVYIGPRPQWYKLA